MLHCCGGLFGKISKKLLNIYCDNTLHMRRAVKVSPGHGFAEPTWYSSKASTQFRVFEIQLFGVIGYHADWSTVCSMRAMKSFGK